MLGMRLYVEDADLIFLAHIFAFVPFILISINRITVIVNGGRLSD